MDRVGAAALSLLVGAPALAQDTVLPEPFAEEVEREPLHTVQAELLMGPGVPTDPGGSTMGQLSLRGEVPFRRWRHAEAAVVVPVNLGYDQEERAGLVVDRTRFEVVPSVRLRGFPDQVFQPYGDLGAGVAVNVQRVEFESEIAQELVGVEALEDVDEGQVGVTARLAAGVAIQPEGFGNAAILVEPAAVSFYTMDGESSSRFTPMVGLGTRF